MLLSAAASSPSSSYRVLDYAASLMSASASGSASGSATDGEDVRVRPFACLEPGCGRRFSRKFTLGEHSKTHTGERPYACPLRACGKRFSTSGNLARHKRLHKDIKPFDCPVATCARTFPTEDKLRHHVKIHTGDKVHVCAVAGCHKTFSTAGNLTRHAKLHHPEVGHPRGPQSPRVRPRRVRVRVDAPLRLLRLCGDLLALDAAASAAVGSPSGVDSMDQRLDRLLLASPGLSGAAAVPPVWPTDPPVCMESMRVHTMDAPLVLPELSAAASSERGGDDADDADPMLDDAAAPDPGRDSLSVLDDVVEFELTEA